MGNDNKKNLLKGKSNYQSWKIRTQATACSQNFLDTLNGVDTQLLTGVNSKGYKAWRDRQNAASKLLIKRMNDNQLHHTMSYEMDPAGLWHHLSAVHEGSGLGGLMEAWQNFHNVCYTDWNDNVSDTTGEIRSLANHLTTNYQDKPSPNQIISWMMFALPTKFNSLITILDNSTTTLTVDVVEQQIISAWKDLKTKKDEERRGVISAMYASPPGAIPLNSDYPGLSATGPPKLGASYDTTCTNPKEEGRKASSQTAGRQRNVYFSFAFRVVIAKSSGETEAASR
ncbi:hypothetical protein BT96DRAFT_947592 [Gymnopus androsaceus JB14]|uniref:DUF4219 domain-containing protein n=1 Tax=Gymnopus androsaceus JB14 TaxID=1447944 RepID=A0A6A4GRP8_9AGAR|nr:hypothetical protein BT96DRAFT_947592 [Gymnopus androsaceus JB14]